MYFVLALLYNHIIVYRYDQIILHHYYITSSYIDIEIQYYTMIQKNIYIIYLSKYFQNVVTLQLDLLCLKISEMRTHYDTHLYHYDTISSYIDIKI